MTKWLKLGVMVTSYDPLFCPQSPSPEQPNLTGFT